MRCLLVILAAINVCGQIPLLSPNAEFDLDAAHKSGHRSRTVRSYFAATPGGLTFVSIDEGVVSFNSADLAGRILYATSDLASVHAQIYKALLRQDGSAWLVSFGPNNLSDFSTASDIGSAQSSRPATGRSFARTDSYDELDLYSPTGEHLEALRLLSPAGGSESPIAAGDDQLVLRSATVAKFGSPQSQLIHFGTALKGQFKERTVVRLAPPILGAIPVLAANGDLLLIDKKSGGMEVIDPNAKGGSFVKLVKPQSVRAAAVDINDLYLLSSDTVLKIALSGQLLSTYRFQSSRGFAPSCLGVTGKSLYLVDASGHAERFKID